MMKKGQGAGLPAWLVALVLVVALILLGIYVSNKYFRQSAEVGFNPAFDRAERLNCEVYSKSARVFYDMDGDGLADSCDPCIDGPDGPEYDVNGNGVSDYCEAKGGGYLGYVEVWGEIDKSRKCSGGSGTGNSGYWNVDAYEKDGYIDMLKCVENTNLKDSDGDKSQPLRKKT
jgi:hypothetical protein